QGRRQGVPHWAPRRHQRPDPYRRPGRLRDGTATRRRAAPARRRRSGHVVPAQVGLTGDRTVRGCGTARWRFWLSIPAVPGTAEGMSKRPPYFRIWTRRSATSGRWVLCESEGYALELLARAREFVPKDEATRKQA